MQIEPRGTDLLAVCFRAMASPCEVLIPSTLPAEAIRMATIVAEEAWRIEKKFSRYREDSVLAWIHRNRGKLLAVDAETAALLDFAQHCYEISDGLFDITSGILRAAWRFDGSDRLPSAADVDRLLPLVGFAKLTWRAPHLMLPAQMELDFGGIGKEYAVDRAYDLLASDCTTPFLINFGGDLRANRPPAAQGSWQVGVERPGTVGEAEVLLDLEYGALATSGDSYRYLLNGNRRYGHVLDPRTGWPVNDAPRSVTVAASSCTEAGLLSTMAMLQGTAAEQFLAEQGVRCWVTR